MGDLDQRAPKADSLLGLRDALAAGELSSVDLVERTLEVAEGSQQNLNAFRVIRSEAALEEAAEADRRIATGEEGPLLGVPVAVKDDTDVAGELTKFGCRGEFEPAREDAELVKRLRAAGAVIVGKTTTSELGQWPIAEAADFGKTRNPWNLDHSPGGSSGGSAAAVAAGIVPAATGSDGAGSVRIPASWCGLVGIKPQRGRVPTWPDAEAFHGLTCHGPLARTVADAAHLLDALTGNHPDELHQPPAPERALVDSAREAPRRLRIALSFKPPFSGPSSSLDARIRAKLRAFADTLANLGHEVTEADPTYGAAGLAWAPRSLGGIAEWADRVPDPELLDPRTRENARNGRLLRGPALFAARKAEGLVKRTVGAIFDDFDVVLTPTTAQPPLPVGAIDGLSGWETDKAIVAACPYAWVWNVVGWPGISVPAGLLAGLPVGAQLLGPENAEPLLISLAAQLEAELRWDLERAPLEALAPSQ
ncbi:MAG: amidase [Solirubrobacterales bacterium]